MSTRPEPLRAFTQSPMGVTRTQKQPGDWILTSRGMVQEPKR